jgi:hypothetical protein
MQRCAESVRIASWKKEAGERAEQCSLAYTYIFAANKAKQS